VNHDKLSLGQEDFAFQEWFTVVFILPVELVLSKRSVDFVRPKEITERVLKG
jgi:hypothetical protein